MLRVGGPASLRRGWSVPFQGSGVCTPQPWRGHRGIKCRDGRLWRGARLTESQRVEQPVSTEREKRVKQIRSDDLILSIVAQQSGKQEERLGQHISVIPIGIVSRKHCHVRMHWVNRDGATLGHLSRRKSSRQGEGVQADRRIY